MQHALHRVSFRPFNFNFSDILIIQYDGLIYKPELSRKVHTKIYLVPYWSVLVSRKHFDLQVHSIIN